MGLFVADQLKVVEELPPDPGRSPEPPRPAEPRLWWEIVAVLCIAVLPDFLHAVNSLIVGFPAASSAVQSIGLAVRSVLVTYAVLFIIRTRGVALDSIGLTRPKWTDVVAGPVIMWLGLAASGLAIYFFLDVKAAAVEQCFEPPSSAVDHVLLVVSLAANAFAEEIVVRGYLISRIERATSSLLTAWLASSAFFACYHVYQGLTGVVSVLTTGLLYGLAFLLMRRVWPLVLAHFLWGLYATYRHGG